MEVEHHIQISVHTDEELKKFLEKPGLLVLDVYSEWCGPCRAMINNLRKIKLQFSDQNLHFAICKSDTIKAFKRFRNKSEPTWLFATEGRFVNLMFGSHAPKLMELIAYEITLLGAMDRIYFELVDLNQEDNVRPAVTSNQNSYILCWPIRIRRLISL